MDLSKEHQRCYDINLFINFGIISCLSNHNKYINSNFLVVITSEVIVSLS